MSETQRQVGTVADARHSVYISLLQRLIQSVPHGAAAVQECVSTEFTRLGCAVERVAYRPCDLHIPFEFVGDGGRSGEVHEAIIGTLRGVGAGRSLICYAHPDSEPIAGLAAWHRQPFTGVVEDRRLYGWGVADDLVGVATMIGALDSLVTAQVALQGNLILASTPSKGRAQGIIPVLDRQPRVDAALYVHPAESGVGLSEIKAITSGMLTFRITVAGQRPVTNEPGHTIFAHTAVNPLDKAWLVYEALQALDALRAERVSHPAIAAAVGRSTNILVSHLQYGDGQRLSRIEPSCTLSGSISFPPGESMSAVQEQVASALARACAEDAWLQANPPRIEWLTGVESAEIPLNHPFYRTVASSIADITGITPHVNPLHSSSDIRNPILHSAIPTVGIGSLVGDLSQNGAHDEWVDIDDYLCAIKVAATVMLRWCETEESAAGSASA